MILTARHRLLSPRPDRHNSSDWNVRKRGLGCFSSFLFFANMCCWATFIKVALTRLVSPWSPRELCIVSNTTKEVRQSKGISTAWSLSLSPSLSLPLSLFQISLALAFSSLDFVFCQVRSLARSAEVTSGRSSIEAWVHQPPTA